MKTSHFHGVRQRSTLALLLLPALAIQGCGNANGSMVVGACRALGICDNTLPEPIEIDLVCDATLGSSCNPETLPSALDPMLLIASDHPGSQIRLWWLGSEVAMTHTLADIFVPGTPRSRGKARNAQARDWVESARAYLIKAVEAKFGEKPGIRSPIAESITKIGLSLGAGSPSRQRFIVLISDARQFSSLADFECGALPAPTQFRRLLGRESLLEPGTLTGATVLFAFTTAGPLGGRPCPVAMGREMKIRELWQDALRTAGASRVAFSSDVPALD